MTKMERAIWAAAFVKARDSWTAVDAANAAALAVLSWRRVLTENDKNREHIVKNSLNRHLPVLSDDAILMIQQIEIPDL